MPCARARARSAFAVPESRQSGARTPTPESRVPDAAPPPSQSVHVQVAPVVAVNRHTFSHITTPWWLSEAAFMGAVLTAHDETRFKPECSKTHYESCRRVSRRFSQLLSASINGVPRDGPRLCTNDRDFASVHADQIPLREDAGGHGQFWWRRLLALE